MPFEVTISNFEGPGMTPIEGYEPFVVDVIAEAPKRPMDSHRHSEFSFSVESRVPINQFARIKVKDEGDVIFRGYTYTYSRTGKKVKWQCRGEEELLMHRFSPRYGYQSYGQYLYHVFQSDAPSQTLDEYEIGKSTGLIWAANSVIPEFWYAIHDTGDPNDWAWKAEGWGTKSRIGSAEIYSEGTLLTELDEITDLWHTTWSCFRDEDDLYFTTMPACDPRWGRIYIAAHNAFDTGVRKGEIALEDTLMAGNFQLNFDTPGESLISIAKAYELAIRYDYKDDATYQRVIDVRE